MKNTARKPEDLFWKHACNASEEELKLLSKKTRQQVEELRAMGAYKESPIKK